MIYGIGEVVMVVLVVLVFGGGGGWGWWVVVRVDRCYQIHYTNAI